MKRSKLSALAAVAAAGVLAVAVAVPAHADSTPQPQDIVGGGSDTTQFAMNNIADGAVVGGSFVSGYNAAAQARLVSWDAITPDGLTSNTITMKAGFGTVTRPNGSSQGMALLHGATEYPGADFARSSSSLKPAGITDGLQLVPFAVDGMQMAVRTAGHNAPATVTGAQLVDIYEGTITNWSAIGGSAGTIVPMIPQAGSGTRATFIAQLESIKGGPLVLGPSVVAVQEHDAAPIAADANAIAPFSTGRASFAPEVSLVTGAGSWEYTRALYNVVREDDLTADFYNKIFKYSGFICSSAAKPLIEAAGFQQLAGPLDGGVCGMPTQTATTNFTVSS